MKLINNDQYTVFSDLNLSKDELNRKISKNYRYEIRRAERENIAVKMYFGKEILNESNLIESFCDTYNQMFAEKKMNKKLNTKYIKSAVENNFMTITIASHEGKNFGFHAYVTDNNNALLLYSASLLWTDKTLGNLIGYANKYLHWKDMCYFKDKGITNYEWGGLASKDTPNGIDKFKMSFGGDVLEGKNYIIANSFKGKLYLKLLKI